jgi:Zn-dependent peptidase ImmA (M78 family)
MAALVRRAFDLQQITDRQYKRLNEQLSALGYRTNEPIPLKSEQPNALRQVVSYHRRSLGYKDVDMEKLLYRSDWDDTFGERTQTPRLRMSSEPMPMYPDERKTM